jgi:protein SCO1/2
MMRAGAILAMVMLAATAAFTPAWAGLPRDALKGVEAAPPPGARLDLALAAPDANGHRRSIGQILGGRRGFVTFVDYTCNTLCGTELMLLADAIRRAELAPSQFRIIVFGIDPKDPASAARTMEAHEIPPALRGAAVFLLPDAATITTATTALGFHYAYDAASDQFAHPAAIYAISSGGAVSGVLSPLTLTAGDLRQVAIARPSPSLLQRIHSLCYAYDPLTGAFNLRVAWLLRIGGFLTLALLGIALLVLMRRGRARA